jgi:hypothetical protein
MQCTFLVSFYRLLGQVNQQLLDQLRVSSPAGAAAPYACMHAVAAFAIAVCCNHAQRLIRTTQPSQLLSLSLSSLRLACLAARTRARAAAYADCLSRVAGAKLLLLSLVSLLLMLQLSDGLRLPCEQNEARRQEHSVSDTSGVMKLGVIELAVWAESRNSEHTYAG